MVLPSRFCLSLIRAVLLLLQMYQLIGLTYVVDCILVTSEVSNQIIRTLI
jgi:hypothetical protein